MIWRRLFLLSSIVGLILLVRILVLACASGWESEYSRIFFFLPETTTNADSHWWFRQTKYYDYDEQPGLDTTVELSSDIKVLCKEWNGLLGTDFALEDIADAVFYRSAWESGEIVLQESATSGAGDVLAAFREKENLYEYLLIAKEMEQFQPDPYESSEKELKAYGEKYKQLREELIKLANKSKKEKALYEKYLYQLIRLGVTYHESETYSAYYEEFARQQVSPVLQGWGRLYYLYITGDPNNSVQINRGLAEVMRLSPGKSGRCIELFRAMKNSGYIVREKDPEIRANMLSMQAFHDYRPQMESLRLISEWHPANVLLPDLVTREINKYEDHVYSAKLTGVEVLGYFSSDQTYRNSFLSLVQVLTKLSFDTSLEAGQQNFYTLALAHCHALAGKGEEALRLLQAVKPGSRAQQAQKLLTELFVLSGKDLSDNQNLNRIAGKIAEVYALGRGSENVNRCLSSTLLKMHKALMDKKQVALAGLYLLRSNMALVTDHYFNNYSWFELNATHTDFAELERILVKENKTAMEKLLVMGIDIHTVHNSRAKVYLRECNLDSAITYLDKLPEWFYAKKYNFLVETSVFFKEEKERNKTVEVIEALRMLRQRVKKAETLSDKNAKAAEYLAVANAFFELSNKGQYCYTTAYYSTSYGPRSVKEVKAKRPESFYSFYFQAEPAFRYFSKAKELSTDKELSAAIQYWYMRAFDRVYESTQPSAAPVAGWIEYLSRYEQTDFYQTHSCPGIEEYRRN